MYTVIRTVPSPHQVMSVHRLLPTLFLFLFLAHPGRAQERVIIDGAFRDWAGAPVAVKDPVGDAGASGIDFTDLALRCDSERVYIAFTLASEVLLQEDNAITLHIDTDANATTGTTVGGLGAELSWTFGDRQGRFFAKSGPVTVKHAAIALHSLPTMMAARFEMSLSRSATIQGAPLFPPGRGIRVQLVDATAEGDRMPDANGWLELDMTPEDLPPLPHIDTDRRPGTVRLMNWNILQDGLLNATRRPIIARILAALAPDIISFQECFKTQASAVRDFLTAALPPAPGRVWSAVRVDSGNVLATTCTIERSTPILQRYRETASLVTIDPVRGHRLLVISAHLRCCDADDDRQLEADATIAFLRDMKLTGAAFPVPMNTPIVILGDFNLVGSPQQLTTLLTGEIVNTARFGASAPPDWGGRPLINLVARHVSTPYAYTWYEATNTYASGKLDYVLHSHDGMQPVNAFVFQTDDLTTEALARMGLNAGDSQTASDHLPNVIDLDMSAPAAIPDPPAVPAFSIIGNHPNPFLGATTVRVSSLRSADAVLTVSSLDGRIVVRNPALHLEPGIQDIPVVLHGIARGVLIVELRVGDRVATAMMLVGR